MRRLVGALLMVVLAAGAARAGEAADVVPRLSDREALRHRIVDAGCYAGPIDALAGPTLLDALKACPDQDPVLRIETGMHTAPIKRIGVDTDCTRLATGSDDKTVRLWAMPEGRPLRTIRLPVEGQDGGKIYAVALSPDGRTLAAGGVDAAGVKTRRMAISIVDLDTGGTKRIGDFEDVVNQIAFSPDGRKVGIGLAGDNGVRVLDRDTGRELLADREFSDAVYGLAFGPDGSLFATSYDGVLRRYGPDLRLAARAKATGGQRPYAIAVDPSGRLVGVGYEDRPAVSIIDAATLTTIAEADTGGLSEGNLSSLAWSGDGQQLAAGGAANQMSNGRRTFVVRRFDPNGHRIDGDTVAADDTITDIKPCGAGFAVAAADPAFGLLGLGGDMHPLQGPVTVDMRSKLDTAFMVSADGSRVRFGLHYGEENPVLFDLAAGTLTESAVPPVGLAPPSTLGFGVTRWKDDVSPELAGKALGVGADEMSRSLAGRADRTGFVIGSVYRLRAFDQRGTERWSEAGSGVAWGVDVSPDGRVVVVAEGDGTIRWHRWSDGKEVLALFVHAPTRRWVAWTPAGYYMASQDAEDLIGWHLNRGWEQEADFFPASRFRDKNNRPDIVRTILRTLDEDEAVRQANDAAKRRDEIKPVIQRLPPIIAITSPSDGARVPPGTVDIRYRTRSPSGGTIDRVEAFVDGAKVEARGLANIEPVSAVGDAGSIALTMPRHDAVISLVAYAEGKASEATRIQLKAADPSPVDGAGDDPLKPRLYALLIGVSHYRNKNFDLGFAAKDAIDFAGSLRAQKGRLYKDVEIQLLTDQDATATALKEGLLWLRNQTTARDIAVVFAAGHGMTDAKGKFWFLTTDGDPARLLTTAVSRDDIAGVLFDLPGKKVLFLDACHSGAAFNEGARGLAPIDISGAINDFAQAEGGVVAYAASTSGEFSFEREEWGHGAFTKALIEGFGGKADLLHKGTITTASLDAFLADRVKELTGGQQHPVMTRPKTVPDFPLATSP